MRRVVVLGVLVASTVVAVAAPPAAAAATCPTTDVTTWTNPTGGNWSTAANWDNGVPDATTHACIDLTGTPYVVAVVGSTGNEALSVTIASTDATLSLSGNGSVGNAVLDVADSVVNDGTIEITNVASAWAGTLDVAGGTLLNTGTVHAAPGVNATSAARTIRAPAIDNQGTFDVDARTTIRTGSLTSSGTLDVGPFTLLVDDFDGTNPAVTTSGTFHVDGTYDHRGGSVTFAGGTVDLTGATFNPQDVDLVLGDAAVVGDPELTLLRVDLTLADPTPDPATFTFRHLPNTITGDVDAEQRLVLSGDGFGNATVQAPAGLANAGVIELTTASGTWAGRLEVTGTLANTGTIHVSAGGDTTADRHLAATSIDNTGTIDIDADLVLRTSSASLTNTGTIDVADDVGVHVDDLAGSGPAFTTTGDFVVDGSWTQVGGSVDFADGTVDLTGGGLSLQDGDLTIGDVDLLGDPSLVLVRVDLALADPTPAPATFTFRHLPNTITGDVGADQRVVLSGDGTFGDATLQAPAGLHNAGTIELANTSGSWAGFLEVIGTLHNTGTIHATPDGDIAAERRLSATSIDNDGTIEVEADLRLRTSASSLTNTGTVTIAEGATLAVDDLGGSNPAVTTTGTFDVEGSYAQIGGTFDFAPGSVTGTGSASFTSAVVRGAGAFGPDLTIGSSSTLAAGASPGAIDLAGDLDHSGTYAVELGGTTPGTEHDVVRVAGTATLAGTIAVSLVGGFTPDPGDSFEVLTYGDRAGTFTTETGFGSLVSTYGAASLVLGPGAPASTVPGPPTGVSAVAGDGEATVSWSPPADDGGSPITGYTVEASPGGATVTVGGGTTSTPVGGLDNGTAYTFTIVATNENGESPPSAASAPVTPEAGDDPLPPAPPPQPPPPSAPPSSLPDDPCDGAGHPFADTDDPDVACLAHLGIAHGITAETFGPSLSVTRGQFASLVARALERAGAVLPGDPPDAFGDDDGSVHEPAIDALAAAGIVDGVGPGEFAPHAPVGRAQAASILAAAHALLTGSPLPAGPDAFGDDDGSVHEAHVDALAAAGIVDGVGPGEFDPGASMSRRQVAAVLVRWLRYTPAWNSMSAT